MQAFDKAKADPNIDQPYKYVQDQKLRGWYRCCVYKWKNTRKRDHWTLLCTASAKLAKTYKELPNVLRKMLGHEMKFSRRTSGVDPASTCTLPSTLLNEVSSMVDPSLKEKVVLIFLLNIYIYSYIYIRIYIFVYIYIHIYTSKIHNIYIFIKTVYGLIDRILPSGGGTNQSR